MKSKFISSILAIAVVLAMVSVPVAVPGVVPPKVTLAAGGEIVINEIMFDPIGEDAGMEWIELYNNGTGAYNINGSTISNRTGEVAATLPNWSFPNQTYLVVCFGNGTNDANFSDGAGSFYTGIEVEVFNNTENDVALYTGSPDSSTIIDYVCWCADGNYNPGPAHDYAVSAGIWNLGEFFEIYLSCAFGDEWCIGRDSKSTDTNSPDDWYGGGGVNAIGPTSGKDNDAFNIYDKSILGTIRDTDGNPISGVKVEVYGSPIETYTDANGTYNLTDVPVGEVPIVFSKAGYIDNTRLVPVSNHDRSFYSVVLVAENAGTPIGPSGGTVYGSGNITVDIPPGALNETVNITITPIPPKAFPETSNDGNYSLPLNSAAFGPSNLTFNQPVNITIPFTYIADMLSDYPMEEKNGSLRFSYFDPETLTWMDGGNATLNPGNTSATIQVNHFCTIELETFGYYWNVDLTDDGFFYFEVEKTFLGNVPCGRTNTITYTKTHSVTVSGDLGVDFDMISASVGVSETETVEASQSLPVMAGPCEEIFVYAYPTYKKWTANIERAGGWKLFTEAGWTFYGTATIYVPQPGVKWVEESIDRTKDCCPPKETPEKGSYNVPVTTTGSVVFCKSMNTPSVEGAITVEPHITVCNAFWSANNTTITLYPCEELFYGTTYTVTIGTDAMSEEGYRLPEPYSFSFLTEPSLGNYTLGMTISGNGTTIPAVGGHIYPNGTVVNISATPDVNYTFVNWTGDVSTIADVNSANTTITMLDNYSVTANFVPSGKVSILFPSSAPLVYGQWPIVSREEVRIEAYDTEFREDITSVTFEYSTDASNWTLIGTDTDPSPELPISQNTTSDVFPGYSGWNVIWNTTGLNEGKYYIRANMSYSSGPSSEAIEEVYFTPTPPRPEIVRPTFLETVSGQFEVNATSLNPSILSMDVDILVGSKGKHRQQYFKGKGKASNVWKKTKAYSAPEAAAQAIWRLANAEGGGNQALLKAGRNITNAIAAALDIWPDAQGTFIDADGQLTFEGLMLVLAFKMRTAGPIAWMPEGMTDRHKIKSGVDEFLKEQDLNCENKSGYTVTLIPRPNFNQYNSELGRGESVILSLGKEYDRPGGDEKAGTVDDIFTEEHAVTAIGSSSNTKKVDYMKGGVSKFGWVWKDQADPRNPGLPLSSLKSLGKTKYVLQLVSISAKNKTFRPKDTKGAWVPKGTDHYGGDGWSVLCDSSDIHDGFYLVRATMNDTVGNWGEDFTTVYINNQIPSAPVNLIASLQDDGTIKLSWHLPLEEPGYDIYGYKVYRDRGFGYELITPEPVPGMFYVDLSLQPTTTYTYKVSAVDFADSEGELSAPSNPIEAPLVVMRNLPADAMEYDAEYPGDWFWVYVNFSAPVNNFASIGLTDLAPAGWEVDTNVAWCTPVADWTMSPGNKAEYSWAGPFPECTNFTARYKVTIPATASPGINEWPNCTPIPCPPCEGSPINNYPVWVEYWFGADGPFESCITGEREKIVTVPGCVVGETRDVVGNVLDTVQASLFETVHVWEVSDTSSIVGTIAVYENCADDTGYYWQTASKYCYFTLDTRPLADGGDIPTLRNPNYPDYINWTTQHC